MCGIDGVSDITLRVTSSSSSDWVSVARKVATLRGEGGQACTTPDSYDDNLPCSVASITLCCAWRACRGNPHGTATATICRSLATKLVRAIDGVPTFPAAQGTLIQTIP
mgnify:FL=1|jgi:hypothetical protein